jgi:hypothetical protein
MSGEKRSDGVTRAYLDPGDRHAALAKRLHLEPGPGYDPPRLCIVLTRPRPVKKGEKGGPRNVTVFYPDDGTRAAIPFPRRLTLDPDTRVIWCQGCQRAWVQPCPKLAECDGCLTCCACTCSDPGDPLYEAWVTDPASVPAAAWGSA